MNEWIDILPEQIDDIIQIIREQYGYDFGDYSRASFTRRVKHCMQAASVKTVSDLQHHLLNEPSFFNWFLQTLTVNVTEMFRDPIFYKALRETVIPRLASYPIIKIWHAGCATGEEVFSMAILLKEAGLLDRTRIYATDLNPANLEKARRGIMPLNALKEYTANYLRSGGTEDFSSYYEAKRDHVILDSSLLKNVLFSQHNLVTDQVFNEFQLICCRNVLIYFNKTLQNRVLHLFYDSLVPLGYMALGMKESLLFMDVRPKFDTIKDEAKIFRRKS
ncbi:protein-glutamate O-methyltransferase CheR [Siphonobacter sp. SORGH_AS_0500]|uniref:CheR family methyltransferase n=1 Tax=Siphonobacter sp. SORGH_AS_0500 TaxID=1864824 RepID=UPI000CB7B6EC|nr:protein-glutamate O-methyltransferase CheR [Siphonobacter sp. SORGH_AS_0500]MDR6194380.1 chemotaxis protein methyltransferase CheR [Siphonobacter sp. SORGH_AS_0500]PKK37680.1 chemotaxis protein CheR [Siphonobacter sp. SORGH_AS_0500]